VYPFGQRLGATLLFVVALLLPLIPAIIGFLVAISVPPQLELHEAISRLYSYFPNLITRNPSSVLVFLLGMWILSTLATLRYFVIYSLVIVITEKHIAALICGHQMRCFPWRNVERIEKRIVQEYDGMKWQKIGVIKIQMGKQCLVIRETIVNFGQMTQLIWEYSEQHRIPTVDVS
jgi:hypothetical protein